MGSNFGVRIAKEGVDAITGDQADMYVDTNTPLPKVAFTAKGEFNFASALSSELYTAVIETDLDFVPNFFVYCERQPQALLRPVYSYDAQFDVAVAQIFVTSIYSKTDNSIFITASGSLANVAGIHRWYCRVFYDPTEEV